MATIVLSYQVSILYALGLYSLSMKMCMNCELTHECYKKNPYFTIQKKKNCSQSNSVSVIW